MSEAAIAPRRAVGRAGAVLMPVNGMVGAGIFAAPAILYAEAGDFAPWMLGGMALAFLPIAWCYARLAGRFDHSGGPQLFAQTAFGPFAGFQAGWMGLASASASGAANCYVLVAYLAAIFPAAGDSAFETALVCAILTLFGWLNYVGIGRAVAALGGFSAIKFVPLVLLAIVGLVLYPPEVRFVLPSFSTAESVALITFYTFMGFEGLATTAGEVKDPRRAIPSALLLALGIITALYMALAWAYIGVGAGSPDDEMPLATMAAALAGPAGALAIAVAAVFSIAANTLHGLIYAPRFAFGMAESGVLPQAFAHVSLRYRTPDVAIGALTVAALAFALSGAFVFLAVASTLMRIAIYVLSAASLVVIRRREAVGEGGAFGLAYALFPALAIVACLWVGWQAQPRAFMVFGLVFVLGTVIYTAARRGAVSPRP